MTDLVAFDGGGRSPAITSRFGPSYEWHQAAGYARDWVESHFATFEIVEIGQRRPGTAVDTPLAMARSLLSAAAFMPGCDALELRYLAVPEPTGPARVRMFVTAKSCVEGAGPQLAAAAATAAVSALPADYVRRPVTIPWMEGQSGTAGPIFELQRNEVITEPTWTFIPSDFYYYISDTPGDGSGWRPFWHSLAGVSSPATISVLFKPTDLDPEERHLAGALTTQLGQLATTRRDYNMIGYEETYPACENAAAAFVAWQERLRLLRRPLLARVAVRGDLTTAMPLSTALAAAISESSDPRHVNEPMRVASPGESGHYPAAADGFDWLDIFPWGGSPLWQDPVAPQRLRRFRYLYGVDEASGLCVLPIPDEQGVPGFTRARRIAPRRSTRDEVPAPLGITLGYVLHEGVSAAPAVLPLSAVNRHVLVTGTPGSGKTTTVLTLLTSLWRDHGIPFLVIEPTKAEYRTLLNAPGMEKLRVIVLGRDDIAPMRLNPLAPPDGVRMEVQANAVLAALKAALPLHAPLPQLLEESIERAYRRAGWGFDTTNADGLPPPSLRTVMACFGEAFAEAGYVGEARNVASAMETRLRSLVRGSKGRVLDTVESVDFRELLSQPVVIEMDEVTDPEDKAVMASFILDRVRAGARTAGSSEGRLRHVTVIEEAHRLLTRPASPSAAESESSRGAGVEAFSNAIAELRSVGEGFILSSQSPSRLAAAAVDNCGSRILHRIESAADREAVLADFDASQLEREAAARLAVGEAVVRWPDLAEPEFIRISPAEGVDSGGIVPVEQLKDRMQGKTTSVRRLLPYPLCTREVCSSGCDPVVRSFGEVLADDLSYRAAAIWTDWSPAEALPKITAELLAESGRDRQRAYCGAAHLSAFGHALIGSPRRVDLKARIRTALEGPGD